MEVKICTNEILLYLLFNLMDLQFRKCVTASEVEHFQEYIKEETKKQGVDVTFIYDMTERLALIRKCIDTVVIEGKIVYRLNYSITVEEFNELEKLLQFYQASHMPIPAMKDIHFITSLNDYTSESEKECEQFRLLDERRILEKLYQLHTLEQQEAEINNDLCMMVLNGAHMINGIDAKDLLAQNLDITKSEFITRMGR